MSGDLEWVALHRSPVAPALGLERRERGLVLAGRGARELDRPQRGVACRGLVEAALAREAPGSVDEDPDADAFALRVAQVVDLAVLRDRVLAPERDRACVGVGGSRSYCCIDCCLGQRLHRRTLTLATLAVARAGGG